MSPFLRDLALTTATSMATVVASLFVTRILAGTLGPADFGAYTIARRVVAMLVPVSTLSTGVALTRYLGLVSGRREAGAGYLSAALAVTLAFTAITVIALLGLQGTWAAGFFGDPSYGSLVAATALMLGGASLFEIAYANYRGRLQMARANLWQLALGAIGPLVVALVWAEGAPASRIVILMGALAYPVALVLAREAIVDVVAARREGTGRRPLKDLLLYGLPRIPGTLALAGLMALGPALAASFFGLAGAGLLAVGQYMVRIVEAAFVAFGVVAMPRVARQLGAGDERGIAAATEDLVAFLFQIGLYVTVHLWLWADVLVPLWLGADYAPAVTITRVAIVSLAPYLAYSLLHSVVNALEVKAINTRTAVIALVVAAGASLGLYHAGAGLLGMAASSSLGFAILGLLTLTYLFRRLHLSWRPLMFGRVTLANIPLCTLAWAAHRWLVPGDRGLVSLAAVAAIEGAIFLSYLVLLRHWHAGWVEQLAQRIRIRSA